MSRYGFENYRMRADLRGHPQPRSGYDRAYGQPRSAADFGQYSPRGGWRASRTYDHGYRDAGYGRGWRDGGDFGPSHEGVYGSAYEYGDLYDDTDNRGHWPAPERGGVQLDDGSWAGRPPQRDYGLDDADRVRAEEIMTEQPEVATPDMTVAEVARRMKDLDVGIIPVVDSIDERRLEGVVTDRDLTVRALAEGKDGTALVREFMTRDVETVTPYATVRDVMDTMKQSQVRRVPVVDRENRLVGIVAQADLAVQYAGLDLGREAEVEEVLERISEPARPRRREVVSRARNRGLSAQAMTYRYDRDFGDRLRYGADRLRDEVQEGWRELRHTARDWIDRGRSRF
jgi:CBS domain-containing protein